MLVLRRRGRRPTPIEQIVRLSLTDVEIWCVDQVDDRVSAMPFGLGGRDRHDKTRDEVAARDNKRDGPQRRETARPWKPPRPKVEPGV